MGYLEYIEIWCLVYKCLPDNKVHGANKGPIWDRQDPGGPHVAPWTLLSGSYCYSSPRRSSRLDQHFMISFGLRKETDSPSS